MVLATRSEYEKNALKSILILKLSTEISNVYSVRNGCARIYNRSYVLGTEKRKIFSKVLILTIQKLFSYSSYSVPILGKFFHLHSLFFCYTP